MKSFAMYGSNVEYTNRRDTVAVLTAFISDQMAAFALRTLPLHRLQHTRITMTKRRT